MTADQLEGLVTGIEIDPGTNPEMANMLGNLAMGVGEDEDDKPILISAPPDGTVTLPGGYLSEGGVIKEARVRELCGEDEEELSRPAVTRDFTKFINTLLVRCVERIGDHPCTQEMLDDLLIGDRDMLLQGIRIATYGDVMRLDLTCPRLDCKHEFQVDYSFTKDVKVRQLDGLVVKLRDGRDVITLDAARHTYFVPLRKGGSVEINLINGGTQRSVYTAENSQRTAAEINTMLLKRCILTIDGDPVPMAAIRSMGTADRQALLQFLTDSQPGPLWDEVKQACPECDREFPLVIDVATMFRGF